MYRACPYDLSKSTPLSCNPRVFLVIKGERTLLELTSVTVSQWASLCSEQGRFEIQNHMLFHNSTAETGQQTPEGIGTFNFGVVDG